MPTAFERASGGNALVMIDNVDGITNAAPAPATARQTIRKLGPVAAAASAYAAPNTTNPAMSVRLRPNRSPSAPAGKSRPANTTE